MEENISKAKELKDTETAEELEDALGDLIEKVLLKR